MVLLTILDGNISVFRTTVDPNGTTAAIGSIAIRIDAGNAGIWINTTGLAVWVLYASLGATGWLLTDNANPALDIGSTGLTNLLRFITTNGAEEIEYRGVAPFEIVTGGLTVTAGTVILPEASLATQSVFNDSGNGLVRGALWLRQTHGAGASFTDVVLPARVGGWRVVDGYIRSGGAAAGSVQLQTAGGAANISNAMVPGAGLDDITRAGNISTANGTIASGGTIRFNIAAGALAGEAFARIEPL